ncbi:MAG: helix-turn-helix domain-containing protein [Rhodobacteraceae bacterium]|jgi:transposase-like protein|nr:helix-turn-helix domain-containing protein [Paracoccaceae bacterium]
MTISAATTLPLWLPKRVQLYISHIEEGVSLRALARRTGLNASTVLRQVRRYENRRDDPLMDGALATVSQRARSASAPDRQKDTAAMTAPIRDLPALPDEAQLAREGTRVLRRLAEPGAMLAFSADMDKAVVMRELPDGRHARTAVLDRAMAQAFCLKDWISCRKAGRVSTYEITSQGRAALKRMLDAETRPGQPGLAEAATRFADQHRVWGARVIDGDEGARRMRVNVAESPVAVLGRRRDKDGRPFLEPELVEAAERLREDFELAQMGPRVAQNWERFLTGADRGDFRAGGGQADGGSRARERVAAALRDLGPGLGDVALRVCCFLEGIEAAEQRMGWAARSGKIVLRIALMRLRRHYDETYGRHGPLIG